MLYNRLRIVLLLWTSRLCSFNYFYWVIVLQRDVNQTSLPQIFYDLASITKQYQRNFTEVKQLHYIVKIFASIGAAKLPMRKQLQQVPCELFHFETCQLFAWRFRYMLSTLHGWIFLLVIFRFQLILTCYFAFASRKSGKAWQRYSLA